MDLNESKDRRPKPVGLRRAVYKKAKEHPEITVIEMREYWNEELDSDERYSEPHDKTLTRWMRGEHLGKGGKDRVLQELSSDSFREVLQRTRFYPDRVIERILEAVNGPKRGLDDEWGGRIEQSLKTPQGRIRWSPWDLDHYIHTIRAAELLEDFETQFVELLQEHDPDDFAIVTWLTDVRSGKRV